MKYARIENNKVMEIIDFNPKGIFSKDLIFVECTDEVEQNWIFEDEKFSAPIINDIKTPEELYEEYRIKVKEFIRQKYKDADAEFAILRKHSAGIDGKNEFEEYNTYVEQCKAQAKEELGLL